MALQVHSEIDVFSYVITIFRSLAFLYAEAFRINGTSVYFILPHTVCVVRAGLEATVLYRSLVCALIQPPALSASREDRTYKKPISPQINLSTLYTLLRQSQRATYSFLSYKALGPTVGYLYELASLSNFLQGIYLQD